MSKEDVAAVLATNRKQSLQIDRLTQQLEWFKQQVFGTKSERRVVETDKRQLALGEWQPEKIESEVTVGAHRRRVSPKTEKRVDESQLLFDESVPVEEICLAAPTDETDAEVVSHKVTYRLAQRPSSYVVLKYIRPVVKQKDGKLVAAPAPAGVLGKSVADVSLLANLVIDKFRYHLPLYRQHQRMEATGVKLARSTLTHLVQRTADLLEPIYIAQMQSVLDGELIAMDETPIKAGRKGKGKMKTAYFWAIYGDCDEVVFPFSTSRSTSVISELLADFKGRMINDGYSGYTSFKKRVNGIVQAQCWSHTRRQFLKAENIEPELTAEALDQIRALYEAEERIQNRKDEKRLEGRAKLSKPIVDHFFKWLRTTLAERALLPSNPFTGAAGYALDREAELRVFLEYPDVPLDTNHLEREIRPIALGRKNWMFCWTEVGAKDVGIFQSLIATCRLHGVDPYTYLVDVLQRVEDHPAREVATLTPRLWKDHFAADPLKSEIDR